LPVLRVATPQRAAPLTRNGWPSSKPRASAAGVYSQTTDVELEINGLMTYDRNVIKIPAEKLRALHAPLYKE
jgi:hypothetical protein